MAQWYCTSRSNYFRVKDKALFLKWVSTLELDVLPNDDPDLFAITSTGEYGEWPWQREAVEGEEGFEDEDQVDIDISNELSKHLAEGEIAVLMSSGAEKLRYLTGDAVAVNHKGETVRVQLDDIYAKASKKFGVPKDKITQASY